MIIEITRPRGQSVAVDLGQAQEVIKKYQSMMTLGFTWNRSRIACWKDLEALPQQTGAQLQLPYSSPDQMLKEILDSIQNIVERRRVRREAQHIANIRQLTGLPNATGLHNPFDIKLTPPNWRGKEQQSTLGRIVKVKLQMSPYDVAEFARDLNALVKKYNRTTVRRGWRPAYSKDVAQRYLRRY